MTMTDLHEYAWKFNLIKNVEYIVVSLVFVWKVAISVSFFITSYLTRRYFCIETANENIQLKETKSLISNSYLIRQNFQGYSYKSGIAIFEWRVTWWCDLGHTVSTTMYMKWDTLYPPPCIWCGTPCILHHVYDVGHPVSTTMYMMWDTLYPPPCI